MNDPKLGRPRLPHAQLLRPMTVCVSEEMRTLLKDLAAQEGVPVSVVCRRLMLAGLEQIMALREAGPPG